jgi:hypothetical protein
MNNVIDITSKINNSEKNSEVKDSLNKELIIYLIHEEFHKLYGEIPLENNDEILEIISNLEYKIIKTIKKNLYINPFDFK